MGNSLHSSRLYGFFCELRRRKVWRVAAGYSVVGWLIIQFATAVFPALALPVWTARLVIILVLAGFPIALILAWAFDVGSDGIKVAPDAVAGDECPPAWPGRRRNIFALALIGLLVSALIGYFVFSRVPVRKLEKSIAVLPFANFSDDPANAFFADGIQDDVLTNLAKIGDLKVISRTSVMLYRGHQPDVRRRRYCARAPRPVIANAVRYNDSGASARPGWDGLRGDTRFQRMLAKFGGKP